MAKQTIIYDMQTSTSKEKNKINLFIIYFHSMYYIHIILDLFWDDVNV
jgi:hypothetical protein